MYKNIVLMLLHEKVAESGPEWTDIAGAIAAGAGVITAIAGVYIAFHAFRISALTARIQLRSARLAERAAKFQNLTSSASILTTMSLAFETPDMRRRRRVSARSMLDRRSRNRLDLCDNESVLDFLEEVAYLTKREILDKDMVWNHFSWHVERYYQAATAEPNLIERARAKYNSNSLYCEIEWLHTEIGKIREQHTGTARKILSEKEIREFLKHESELMIQGED